MGKYALNRLVIKGLMHKLIGRILREQSGQALPLALAMLAIGSLIVVPLLNLTATALRAGTREERQMYEHYAANAGIMDCIRKIIIDDPHIPPHGEGWSYDYSIPDTNNRSVDVIISTIDQNNWKITSTAISGNGGSTELECYIEKKSYLPNAVTSTSVIVNNDGTVNGNVQWNSVKGTLTNPGIINGEIIDSAVEWPTIEEVEAFYLDQVDGAPIYEGNLTLSLGPETLADPYSLGPIYINGNLVIGNGPSAVRLDGLVYVNGSVSINREVNAYMNNNTIFSQSTFWASPNAKVYEYGCIVSIPIITFYPDMDRDSCVILWTVDDQNTLDVGSAGKTIYGAAYSPYMVTVARASTLTYTEFPPDMSIPPLPGGTFRIVGWESTSQ
ncbi:hypothetical protein ACFLWN_01385 [Chloroflexota bacterium]